MRIVHVCLIFLPSRHLSAARDSDLRFWMSCNGHFGEQSGEFVSEQGSEESSPKILQHPSEDLQAVPTEYKSVVGSSQTEPSNAWRGERVLWLGAEEAPYALTFNKVISPLDLARPQPPALPALFQPSFPPVSQAI